jgi:hypothetical protein
MAHALARPIFSSLVIATACSHDVHEQAWPNGGSADGGDDGTADDDDADADAADDAADDGSDGVDSSPGDGDSASDGGGTTGADDGGGEGPGSGGPPGEGGPCGCGFPEFACEPDFLDPEGTEGPMPPLCGGGSGLGDGPPTMCFGGNFGTYGDVDSFCSYIANRWRYLENECGNFNTATLTIDLALSAIADEEAKAVAGGADPKGPVVCGGSPCGPLDGPAFNLGSGASWLYIDGWVGMFLAKDAMFTAPETEMIVQSNPLWSDQQGNPIYERACQFTSEFANSILYHYCDWEGMGAYGDPSTQPSRVGCGTAVDTDGITWRVVKLGE